MVKLTALIFLIFMSFHSHARQPDPIYRETEIRNERPRASGEIFDIQEINPNLTLKFSEADKKAEIRVGNVNRDASFIHKFWQEKKSILLKDYNIEWRSPAELNPGISYGDYGQPEVTESEGEYILRYLESNGHSVSEAVIEIWREFEGAVHLSTEVENTNMMREYKLLGSQDQWKLIEIYFVQP